MHFKHEAEMDYTGLYNKCWFMRKIAVWMNQAKKNKGRSDFAVLYFDLNGFKGINDTYGHDAGDEILLKVVHAIKSCLRKGIDYGVRWGGDEFAVIMSYGQTYQIVAMAEALNDLFSRIQLRNYPDADIKISASIGAACFTSLDDINFSEFFKKLDRALYAAKNTEGVKYKICSYDKTA
jgi:diguanylate cyclase (GGDEF)-like protein